MFRRFLIVIVLAAALTVLWPAVQRSPEQPKYTYYQFIYPTYPPKTADGKLLRDFKPALVPIDGVGGGKPPP